MPVNKMLIETYMKKLKMPQVAKTYDHFSIPPFKTEHNHQKKIFVSIYIFLIMRHR